MVLGMEVGLSPGDLVVLDGDPAPSPNSGLPENRKTPQTIAKRRRPEEKC